MPVTQFLNIIVLWVHLFSAVLFVGGSFFMWMVIVPASHLITSDESERTRIVGKIARNFGNMTNVLTVVLVVTGLYNATWYLPSANGLLEYPGTLLLAKVILVTLLLTLIYVHNVYFGKRIIRLAKDARLDELKALRKRSRIISTANLTLMLLILLLSTIMQNPP